MRRRAVIVLAMLATLVVVAGAAADDEVTLFDVAGKPVAYVTDDMVVYLWSGRPVAYLTDDVNSHGDVFHIYGFNGKHLAWLLAGLIRDHQGSIVGGLKEDLRRPTEPEPAKGAKQPAPRKAEKEPAPDRSVASARLAGLTLETLLRQGAE